MYEVVQTPEFSKWFSGLKDRFARKQIVAHIRKIELGNLGKVKWVGDGVREVKLDFGPGYRLYFTMEGKTLVVLLCGGTKKGQQRDINTAKAIKRGLD